MTREQNRQYLGDGVYVSFDGEMVWLTTENGISVTNRIALEPYVWERLREYVSRLEGAANAAALTPNPPAEAV
jgi:hypothetical protein